jgi:GT2 family glycosyltransferase
MRASIAIAAHNEGDLLWKTVRSCLETTESLDCEVVVVDDGSTDGSVDELRRRFGEVRVVSFPERIGCPAAKHHSALHAKGDVLIFLDAHCKPEGDALVRMVEDVERWDGQAVIAPRIVGLDVANWSRGPDSAYIGFCLELEWFRGGWVKPENLRRCIGPDKRVYYEESCMAGCSLAMSRELYDKLRGFDQDMIFWGMEDQDFALKCWLMGHNILVDPELVIAHRFVSSHPEYYVSFEHLLMNRLRVARRNFEKEVWEDWCWRHRTFYGPKLWSKAWKLFEKNRQSVENDREYFLRVRPHGVYQYAAQFDLAWPLTLAGSPYPAPAVLRRPRYPTPFQGNVETSFVGRRNGSMATTEPPDYTPLATAEPPDYAPLTTAEPPDYAPLTTAEPPDYAPLTTAEPPDYAPLTTAEPPDYAPLSTAEPPDYAPSQGRERGWVRR